MSMITMEDGEDKLCDPDAFAACYGEVEGSLPATWAPPCSATELHAHLQKPEVGLALPDR